MRQEILVPLDGSTLAEAILPYAAALARSTSSNLTLLRAIPPLTLVEPMGGVIYTEAALWEEYQEEPDIAWKYLAGIAASLQYDGVRVQTKVENGDPATCILEYAAQNTSIKYIAMATHGRSGLGRLVFGSVAEKIVHAASVPVLLMRSQDEAGSNISMTGPAHRFENMLVPLDGSDVAERAIEEAVMIADKANAGIMLLSVVPDLNEQKVMEANLFPLWVEPAVDERIRHQNRYLFELAQQLRGHGLKVRTEVSEGDPAAEIIKASDRDNIDMIVMSTHGRGGLHRLWLGSVAMEVVQKARKAVLLVRAGKHAEEAHKVDKVHETAGTSGR